VSTINPPNVPKRANIRVVIIDENPLNRRLIRDALVTEPDLEVLAETDSLVYGYELVRQNRPNLVFIDLRDVDQQQWPEKSLETIAKITTYFKETLVVVSGENMSLELTKACMKAGAREFLERPLATEDILEVLSQFQPTLTTNSEVGDTSGRIITVFSNKGGLGKTTVAVNLALALSQTSQKPVVLVDLNLQLGDITTFLDITPKHTIVDITRNISRVDATYLESSLARFTYNDATVYVLADPVHVEDAEEVTAEQINTVLTVLRASFAYVIIDTNASFDSKTITALDLADHVVLVSMISLPCIRSSQRVLLLFDRLGYDKQKIKLLMNRYVPDDEITIEDVEDTLDHPVYWRIPNSYQVVSTAINRGIPLQAIENSQAIVASFQNLARKISGVLMPNTPNLAGMPNIASSGVSLPSFNKLMPIGLLRAIAKSGPKSTALPGNTAAASTATPSPDKISP
jgi:pilus assembly protein CpaE